jgi:hypothetical protein
MSRALASLTQPLSPSRRCSTAGHRIARSVPDPAWSLPEPARPSGTAIVVATKPIRPADNRDPRLRFASAAANTSPASAKSP